MYNRDIIVSFIAVNNYVISQRYFQPMPKRHASRSKEEKANLLCTNIPRIAHTLNEVFI
jgi:hypothetical protein